MGEIVRSLCVTPQAATASYGSGTVQGGIRDGVAEIRLDRPPLNVLDMRMMHDLLEALAAVGHDSTLRVLVLRSAHKAFSAGADVEEHRGERAAPMIRLFHRLMRALEAVEAPTVAVIGGAALGGGFELALACDMRVVAAEARLGLPEATLGVFPPYAALRLPELTGEGTTARLVLTGDAIDGASAFALGLADRVAPRAEIEQAAGELIASLASRSAATLRTAKAALRVGRDERDRRLDAIETLYLGTLMQSHDAEEGLRAFVEKREPCWKHC